MNYDYWTGALADPARLRARDFKVTDVPQLGFYRDKRGTPVAIWEEEGEGIVMAWDFTEVEPNQQSGIWMSCALRPVPEDYYRHYEEHGRWPDVDEALAGMGDNVRTGMDEVEQIDELERQVKAYREIDSDEEAARAQSLRARFLELYKAVNTKREELKAPHLKAAREVDEAWMAPVRRAQGCANALKALIEGWESRKRKALREQQEQIEAARRAEEKARREAEEANQPVPPPTPKPAPVPEPMTQVRGGTGRAASVREKYVVVGINDLDMALQAYRYSDEVAEAMIKLAQAAVDRGAKELPGFVIELKAVLR